MKGWDLGFKCSGSFFVIVLLIDGKIPGTLEPESISQRPKHITAAREQLTAAREQLSAAREQLTALMFPGSRTFSIYGLTIIQTAQNLSSNYIINLPVCSSGTRGIHLALVAAVCRSGYTSHQTSTSQVLWTIIAAAGTFFTIHLFNIHISTWNGSSDSTVGAASQWYWDELMLLKCELMLLKSKINTKKSAYIVLGNW